MLKGIIYFIQPAELVGTDRYKIGCSKTPDLKRCKEGYRKGSRYICIMECSEPFVLEKKIKDEFNKLFELVAGTEYFIGDETTMKQTFLKITEDYEGSIGDQLEIISDTNDTDDINPNIQNKKLTLLYEKICEIFPDYKNDKSFGGIKKYIKICADDESDFAVYYKSITQQRFIYCQECWYGYDEYNVISKLSKNIPSQLVSNISEVLQKKLKEEIKKIEPDDKTYEETYKLFKSRYKAVGTSSFVKGVIDYVRTFYTDDRLREKLNNNNFLLAFTDKVFDFKIKQARKIEMNDFVSITTGYKYPTTSDAKKQQEIKDLIYSVFEDKQICDYWLETVSMAIHTNKFEKFYIHLGSGRNGKGVLFSMIISALGNYIATADSEFLTTRII